MGLVSNKSRLRLLLGSGPLCPQLRNSLVGADVAATDVSIDVKRLFRVLGRASG